ncbi:MAG: hypothetical protein AAGD22_12070 [Verrucomicrobiota bacterium]
MAEKEEEFFIGWQGRAPVGVRGFLRKRALGLIVLGLAMAGVLALMQGTLGRAFFEFGNVKTFSGVLLKEPVPMLVADEPDETSGAWIYYLVNPFKWGFDHEEAERLNLNWVELEGTLIFREDGSGVNQAMIEVAKVVGSKDGQGVSPLGVEIPLGEMTLRGEIVDSKCYLGVMNPGEGKPHRACAIRCISGGIPPVLLVRDEAGRANYFVMVDENGGSVNEAVLDLVALPVEVTGEVVQLGDRLVLKAAVSAYRLVP